MFKVGNDKEIKLKGEVGCGFFLGILYFSWEYRGICWFLFINLGDVVGGVIKGVLRLEMVWEG